ncbi:unnamed protein product [Effrenium voratum]|nr:unnamed protein product [Effrenium voratum]
MKYSNQRKARMPLSPRAQRMTQLAQQAAQQKKPLLASLRTPMNLQLERPWPGVAYDIHRIEAGAAQESKTKKKAKPEGRFSFLDVCQEVELVHLRLRFAAGDKGILKACFQGRVSNFLHLQSHGKALDQRSTCMTLLASGDPATCPRGANEPSEGLDALGMMTWNGSESGAGLEGSPNWWSNQMPNNFQNLSLQQQQMQMQPVLRPLQQNQLADDNPKKDQSERERIERIERHSERSERLEVRGRKLSRQSSEEADSFSAGCQHKARVLAGLAGGWRAGQGGSIAPLWDTKILPRVGSCKAAAEAQGGWGQEAGKASEHSVRMTTMKDHLQHGGEAARSDALSKIRGNMVAMAMESELSSRAVQEALKVANRQTQTDLSLELTGHIAEVALSLHGNHVLQRVIEVLPASKTHFIAEELMARAKEVAHNVFGCRIFCRLLEQSSTLAATQELITKVMKDAEELVQHQFGRFVAQAILEHGCDSQRRSLAHALRHRIMDMAQHRNASHVIEKALIYCAPTERRALAIDLLQQGSTEESGIELLARTQYGGFVVKALLNLGNDIEIEARRQLMDLSQRCADLKASKETRFVERLLKELSYLPDDEERLPMAETRRGVRGRRGS